MTRTPSQPDHHAAELESARRQIQELESRLTQAQETQQALHEDHRFREAVIERAAEGVCVCHDVEASPYVEFTVWNRRMVEITGFEMEAINRLGWYQSLYPDPEVQEKARERMDRMRAGEDLRFERWEIQRADGTKRAIAISTSVLTAADGSVHVLGLMHDLTGEEDSKTQRLLARTDPLTSLRNRRGFEEEAGLLFRLARRQNQVVTLGYVDVSGFKALNDLRGHLEGDRALEAIAGTLRAAVRSTDVIGRLGGDEFAVVLPGTNTAGAKRYFGDLQGRLLEMTRARGWEIGFSVGVATFSGKVPDLADALQQADRLMYRAKKTGKTGLIYAQFRS